MNVLAASVRPEWKGSATGHARIGDFRFRTNLHKEAVFVWIKEPRRLTDRIDFLGTHELCFYLIRGQDAVIVGGGMSHATPALRSQLDEMRIDPATVKYAVVTHSHFDHCGAVPFFREQFPGIQIIGTAAARDALAKPKVADYNAKMNDKAAFDLGVADSCLRVSDCTTGLSIDTVVSDGESIDLGQDVEVQFYEVPGHSRCCVATYVPMYKALFPTDTTPHPVNEWTNLSFPSAQYSFPLYVESLRRLNAFEVDILGLDHHGAFTGEQAQEFLKMGLQRTLEFQQRVETRYQELQDLDAVAWEIAHEGLQMVKLPFITEDLMFIITRAMLKSVLGIA